MENKQMKTIVRIQDTFINTEDCLNKARYIFSKLLDDIDRSYQNGKPDMNMISFHWERLTTGMEIINDYICKCVALNKAGEVLSNQLNDCLKDST